MNATAFSTICRAHRAFRIAASLLLRLSVGLLRAVQTPTPGPAVPPEQRGQEAIGKVEKNKAKEKKNSAKDEGG